MLKTITVKLPDELFQKLCATAERAATSRSTLIRTALLAYLEEAGESAGLSCLDLARDLCGSLEGPEDLSSNPKHLQGYGA